MVRFESNLSVEELKKNWDEHTSVARFAGSDETMDLVFVSKRNDNKVKLMRRARSVRDPFASIFRGNIRSTDKGSEIVGFFTKAIFDYIIVGVVLALLFFIRATVLERGESLETINALLVASIIGAIALLYNTRAAKRRYAEFIFRITENPIPMFLTSREKKELEQSDNREDV